MKIIVGLGNPGDKYKLTRHNAGFMLLDKLVSDSGETWTENKKFQAWCCRIGGALLMKPTTYMNNSGAAASRAMSYYKLVPKNFGLFVKADTDLSGLLTIIHDDLDIELGKYRTTRDSRSAGHNGLKSVFKYLKTQKIHRIRLGIRADKPDQMPVEKYVLQKFPPPELQIMNKVIDEVINKEIDI